MILIKTSGGCMSDPDDPDCAPIFANLGLPFGDKSAGKQTFFRKSEHVSELSRSAAQ